MSNGQDLASISQTAFNESTFVLVSGIVSFAAGVWAKMLHSKITSDSDLLKELTAENQALKQMLTNPVRDIKLHDLTKEVGEIKQAISTVNQLLTRVEEDTKNA